MLDRTLSTKSRPQPGRIKGIALCLSLGFILSIAFLTNIVLAASDEATSKSELPPVAVQGTATPTPVPEISSSSVYSFSFATLGYAETTLNSPYAQVEYSFRLPENWEIQGDSILDLDLSYIYEGPQVETNPAVFGDLTVTLDGETIEVFPLNEGSLDHHRFQLTLPSVTLNDPNQTSHIIELTLDAEFLCDVAHNARLIVHPTSTISLAYSQRPLVLNLSHYPRPFYQRAFEPDSVRFVLPSHLTASDLSQTLGVAAKLGDLTRGHLIISTTNDIALSNQISSAAATLDEHLIVIGQPQTNQLVSLLNDSADLPVSLHQRQLGLSMQGPTSIAPGDTFTYSFTVTNTLYRDVDLSLINPLPLYAEYVDCTLNCTRNTDDRGVTWRANSLAPNDILTLSLTLKATDVLTGAVLENTATLIEANLGPVNAETLTSTVVTASSGGELQVSAAEAGDYFFVYDGKAVARGDGVVQEVISPWSPNRAILMITGLSDEAVQKAAQAMSSDARFPGMDGVAALVQAALPLTASDVATADVEMTFADLGYPNRDIRGGGNVKQVDYYFEIPYGWQLTEDAYVEIHFSHSRFLDYGDSGLTVLLNGQPAASAAFSDETAENGDVRLALADANLRLGQSNQVTIEVNASMPGVCVDDRRAWVLIKNSSKLFLAHQQDSSADFDLITYPYPFRLNPALTDVLFALPDAPSANELDATLRLVAKLGSSAAGDSMAPVATLGNRLPAEELANYHIIAVGRPSRNALIRQVNALLPQPFLPGSDEIDQRLDGVVFRLPPGIDLGYAQLIHSPWNQTRALLATTGTTDTAIQWVTDVLAGRPWALRSGDLALVQGDEVNTIATHKLTHGGKAAAVATAVPDLIPVAKPTATTPLAVSLAATPSSLGPTSDTPAVKPSLKETEPPDWLIPLVGTTIVVVIVILGIALWQARRRASKRGK